MAHIHRVAPGVPVILDAKRGDIGSTAEQYAREAFERYRADAVTLSPFMGFDSIEPYLRTRARACSCCAAPPTRAAATCRRSAWPTAAASCCTSTSPGSPQAPWNRSGQLGLVVGATFPAEIERVRELAPTLPLLIPGVGAQGGDAAATVRAGWRAGRRPSSWSSSRAILYASRGDDFAAAARRPHWPRATSLAAGRGSAG